MLYLHVCRSLNINFSIKSLSFPPSSFIIIIIFIFITIHLHLIVVSLVLTLLKVHEILLDEEYLVSKLHGFCYTCMHVFICAEPRIFFQGRFQTYFPEVCNVNLRHWNIFSHPPLDLCMVQLLPIFIHNWGLHQNDSTTVIRISL